LFCFCIDILTPHRKQAAKQSLPVLKYELQNAIPFARGLGSSSAAIVSGLIAGTRAPTCAKLNEVLQVLRWPVTNSRSRARRSCCRWRRRSRGIRTTSLRPSMEACSWVCTLANGALQRVFFSRHKTKTNKQSVGTRLASTHPRSCSASSLSPTRHVRQPRRVRCSPTRYEREGAGPQDRRKLKHA